MAEFLVYNKAHWMDNLTVAQLADYKKRYPDTWEEKYAARYCKGDIVEVREDGGYTSTLKGDLSRWPFRIVRVTGLAADKVYASGLIVAGRLTKKARFNTQDGDGTLIHTVATISNITVVDKTNG